MTTERFYEKVEFRRFFSEAGLRTGSPALRGVWFWTLLEMWNTGEYSIKRTAREWSKAWNCTPRTARKLIAKLQSSGVADVTCNGDVTGSNTMYALVCRHLRDEAKAREDTRLRVQKHRDKVKGNPDVTLHSNSNSNSNSQEDKSSMPPADTGSLQQLTSYWTMTKGGDVSPIWRKKIAEALRQGVTVAEAKIVLDRVRVDIKPWTLLTELLDQHDGGKGDGARAGGQGGGKGSRRFASADQQERDHYPGGKFSDRYQDK